MKYLGPKTDAANVATQSDASLFLSGSGAPSSGTGSDGDLYIDTAANQLYGPKASGTWPSPITLGGGGSQSNAFAVFIS